MTAEERRHAIDVIHGEFHAVVARHSRRLGLIGVPFPAAQSLLIGALMAEMAHVIAAGPARAHRAQVKVIGEELGRLVATTRTQMNAEEGEGAQ